MKGCISGLGRMMARGLKPSATFVASLCDALTIAAGFNLRFPKTEIHPV